MEIAHKDVTFYLYVERDGQKFLWIGKRSLAKSTYPGKLDHLVAGGLVRFLIYLSIIHHVVECPIYTR
jgi:hypothetical protein